MNFKKKKNVEDIFNKYPKVLSASVLLDDRVFKVKPLRVFKNDKDIVFNFEHNDYLGDLNDFMDLNDGTYAYLDDVCDVLIDDYQNIEQFDNVGCFIDDTFTILRLSNEKYLLNLVLAKESTFLNSLTIKNAITGKLAKESLLYLIQYQLLGNVVSTEFSSSKENFKTTISPVDSFVIKVNAPGTFGIETLYNKYLVSLNSIDDIDKIKVSYDMRSAGAYFTIDLKLPNDKVFSFVISPF